MGGEDELFSRAMRGVRRIRAEAKRRKPAGGTILARPRQAGGAAVPGPKRHAGPGHDDRPWVLKADGVAEERLKRLAAGNPPEDMEIDLHGMSRGKACDLISDAVARALAAGKRVICLVHGRGLHSSDGRPVLREAVYRWLRDGPFSGQVLAVVPKPGTGGGSCLVLLRRKR